MITAFISLVLLAASSSAGTLHAELRVNSDVKPMKDVRLVYPDTPQGRRYEASYKAHADKNDVPSLMFGGGYAMGQIPNGFAVKTRIDGDRIIAMPIPATLQGKNLSLNFGVCRITKGPFTGPDARNTPLPQLNVSIVQWLIHDMPWADYRVTFKATDLGNCPPP